MDVSQVCPLEINNFTEGNLELSSLVGFGLFLILPTIVRVHHSDCLRGPGDVATVCVCVCVCVRARVCVCARAEVFVYRHR